jgi:hypothetical protein
MRKHIVSKRHSGTILKYMIWNDGGWVRILGFGIAWDDKETHEPMFSERWGYKKWYTYKGYVIKFLKP